MTGTGFHFFLLSKKNIRHIHLMTSEPGQFRGPHDGVPMRIGSMYKKQSRQHPQTSQAVRVRQTSMLSTRFR